MLNYQIYFYLTQECHLRFCVNIIMYSVISREGTVLVSTSNSRCLDIYSTNIMYIGWYTEVFANLLEAYKLWVQIQHSLGITITWSGKDLNLLGGFLCWSAITLKLIWASLCLLHFLVQIDYIALGRRPGIACWGRGYIFIRPCHSVPHITGCKGPLTHFFLHGQ